MTKDPNRPRALHKLSLRPGDVVRLEKWQDGADCDVGSILCLSDNGKKLFFNSGDWLEMPLDMPKGDRPLFRVVSRAKPEPVRASVVLFDGCYGLGLEFREALAAVKVARHRLTIPTADGALIPFEVALPCGAVVKLEVIE